MRNTMRKTKGFTLIEMMMALTITALLLTALAASISGSMSNLKVNEGSYKTINNGRLALGRMCAELRTSQIVLDVSEDYGYCTFLNADGDEVVYFRWGLNDMLGLKKDTLYLRKNSKNYVLCEGVTDMSFNKGLDPADPEIVRNVQINMTVKYGDISKKLSSATVIMRQMP
jgi:prepilin-type N-terminal cleavage/methylation domain-containing protein